MQHSTCTAPHHHNAQLFVLATANQVTDCVDGTIWAAAVYRALDYAFKNGAHMVSCSFSHQYTTKFAPNSPAPPWEDHSKQTAGYTAAIQPLQQAGVLVLAAAGKINLAFSTNPCVPGASDLDCIPYLYSVCRPASPAPYTQPGHQTSMHP